MIYMMVARISLFKLEVSQESKMMNERDRVSNDFILGRAETCSKLRRIPCDKSRVGVLKFSCYPRNDVFHNRQRRGDVRENRVEQMSYAHVYTLLWY